MSRLIKLGAIIMCLAVTLGAFGAHAISDTVTPERLETWKTAVSYQAMHGLGIILAGICDELFESPKFKTAGNLFTVGVTIFSGSLYALVLLDIPVLGAITPIGGIALISGWAVFALGASNLPNRKNAL